MIRTVNDVLLAIDIQQANLGLSDYELARKACIARSTLCRWKYGERIPNLRDILMLMDVLGLTMNITERSNANEQEQINIFLRLSAVYRGSDSLRLKGI